MANKRITELDTQGDIDIENLKFVLDSVADGTKSITFKRVLDFATKQAEIKQAETDIGLIFEWQAVPDYIDISNGVVRIGRRIFALAGGQTITNGVNLYPKYAEFLNRQNAELKAIINGNDYVMPNWINRYLKSGSGVPSTGNYGLGGQSLPGLAKGDLAVQSLTGQNAQPTSGYNGGIITEAKGLGDYSILPYGSATQSPGPNGQTVQGSSIQKPTKIIGFPHNHTVDINHGHGLDGKPSYDRTVAVGDVNPSHANVYRAICIGVDYN